MKFRVPVLAAFVILGFTLDSAHAKDPACAANTEVAIKLFRGTETMTVTANF